MKTENRTMRKILSVLLCALMLTTTCCIVNPFTASAASQYNNTPLVKNYLLVHNHGGRDGIEYFYYVDADFIGTSEYEYEYDDGSTGTQEVKVAYSVHDFNSETTSNYSGLPVKKFQFDENKTNSVFCYVMRYVSGSSCKFWPYDKYKTFDVSSFNNSFYDSYGIVNGFETERHVVLFINTTRICSLYDSVTSTYGSTNGDRYTANTWATYIAAYNKVKDYVTNGVHVQENGTVDIDLQKKLTVACDNLEAAISGLKKPTAIIKDIYKQVTGAAISGSGEVEIGQAFTVYVDLQDGYTQSAPKVRVTYKDGSYKDFSGTRSGNRLSYSVSITSDNVSSISPIDVHKNTYTVSIPSSATGLTITKSGNNTVTHGDSFSFTVTKQTGYTQKTPVVKVDGTQIAGVQDGNTYTYTISGITEDKTVTIDNLEINKYTVSVPEKATGISINGKSATVDYDSTFKFSLTVLDGYTQSEPTVKVNGTAFPGTKNGNTYTYTISNIRENKDVSIDNLKLNKYQYTFPTGKGFTVSDVTGFDHTAITHGDDYKFTVTVNKAYTQAEPIVSIKSGKDVTLESKADGADGSLVYTYIVKNVTAHDEIFVAAMSKNTYSAVLPFGTGYKATNPKADAETNVVKGIVYGNDLAFTVALEEQYNRSKVVVKFGGTILEPDEGGTYTIENITRNIEEGEITVEGVKLNNYYITLPLESESGFTIEVGEGLNAKAVPSGTDFNFKLFLDPAYSNSNPVVKYSTDGGNSYTVITPVDGKYYIYNVLTDCIVVVEGVEKNTYTVKFLDDEKNVLEKKENVEYGSNVEYSGVTPTKPSVVLKEETVDGIKTVVEKRYEFIGWSADTSNVTSDMEVTPIFEVKEVTTTTNIETGETDERVESKSANIIFISDGVIVHKETVEKGTAFAGWNGVPVKTSSNPYETYEFKGWDTNKDGKVDVTFDATAIENVENDVTFVAVFESNLPSQTVTFYDYNGNEPALYSTKVKRGEKAAYGLSSIPSRTDTKYLYEFAGWALTPNADETEVLDKIIVGESDIIVYAAYKKTPIIYTYKFINDGTVLQEGNFNYVDGKPTKYKYEGKTPERASSVSTDYTFDGWDTETVGYTTVYTATYKDSVREYDSKLPTPDGTYSITEDARVKYGDTFTFTVTLTEGYTETKPNVTTASGETLTPASKDGNSYTYEIKLDGKTAEEVENDLTVSVETKINNYDVSISGDEGCEVEPTSINSNHGGNGTFTVTLNEGYTQTAPALSVNGNVIVSEPEVVDGKYVFTISDIKSDAEITVSTVINVYDVKLSNYDGTVIFHDGLTHGSTPEYTNPTKPNDKFGGYTFIGWDLNGDDVKDVDKIENVKSDIDAVAVYGCNHVHADDPDADDSAWTLVSTDKATCTANGTKHYKCSYPGCKETKDVEIVARGHNMTAWNIDKAPTCTETGRRSCFCQNGETDEYKKCNHKVSEIIPATGHHDADGDYKCDDCGADLGHCSSCICHKGNVLSKVIRRVCTLLSKIFRTEIKCCKCMEWYGDEISSTS